MGETFIMKNLEKILDDWKSVKPNSPVYSSGIENLHLNMIHPAEVVSELYTT